MGGDGYDDDVVFPGEVGETSGLVGGGEVDQHCGPGVYYIAVALSDSGCRVVCPVGLEDDAIDVVLLGPLGGEFDGGRVRGRVDEEEVGGSGLHGIEHFEDRVAVRAFSEGREGDRGSRRRQGLILRVRPCGVAFEEVCQEFSAAAWKVFLFEQRAGGGEDFVEVLKFEDFDVLV